MGDHADDFLDESLGAYWPADGERGGGRPARRDPAHWIVVDGDNLCHRAFWTTGQLAEGVLFGFFRALVDLHERFATQDVAICFDCRPSRRQSLHSDYKAGRETRRREMSPEERKNRRGLQRQIHALRDTLLSRLGYRNVFSAPGYEADDVIASVVKGLPEADTAVVVSSDQDLWQLISPTVCCYNPVKHETLTLQGFKRQWGVSPAFWADVKAIAGCSTDDVPGVPGVGEKTAARFLARQLKPESKKYQAIVANSSTWQFNLPLVRLPFDGCPRFALRENCLSEGRWSRTMQALGMDSLVRQWPRRRKAAGPPPLELRYQTPRRRPT